MTDVYVCECMYCRLSSLTSYLLSSIPSIQIHTHIHPLLNRLEMKIGSLRIGWRDTTFSKYTHTHTHPRSILLW